MKRAVWTMIPLLAIILVPQAICADETTPIKTLADRLQRGTLHDAALAVRGDAGRWQDEERWTAAPPPPPPSSSSRLALDDWLDEQTTKKFAPTDADDVWLLFSTRQLNDNDRVWVERVERRGNRITVVVTQAAWRGKYQKNFTYYQVFGVKLGRLEPGTYEATCVLQPASFTQFTGDGRPPNNWPQDDRRDEQKSRELSSKITVIRSSR